MELHSVVVPVYNEELVIERFLRRARAALEPLTSYEIIFVDDGSYDRTGDRIREEALADPRIRLVELSRNFGQQIALAAGIDVAAGDTVTIIDCDLQDPPELIPDMVAEWRKGADVVFAVRRKRSGESLPKRATAALYYRFLRVMTSVDIPVDHSEFRLISRRVADNLRVMRERHRYTRGLVSWLGMNRAVVTYERQNRAAGETKYSYAKLLRVAMDGIVSFSLRPLQLATWLGFAAAVLAVFYGIYVVLHWIITRDSIEGWSSLMVVMLLLGGTQLVTLGLIGEYIGRTYDEVRGRPLYVVSDMVGFNDRDRPSTGTSE